MQDESSTTEISGRHRYLSALVVQISIADKAAGKFESHTSRLEEDVLEIAEN